MKITIIVLIVVVAITFSSVALSGKTTRNAPEGVQLIGDDRAVVKKGYRFSLINELKAQSHAATENPGTKRGKTATGEFTCKCSKGEGSCQLKSDATSIYCQPKNQCEKCQLSFTLPREWKEVSP